VGLKFMLFLACVLSVIVALAAAFVACVMIAGCVIELAQGGTLACQGDWIFFVVAPVVLALISVGLLYLAVRFRRVERTRMAATGNRTPHVDLPCPQCRADMLVKGPYHVEYLFRTRYVARCLTCGEHLVVPRRVWEGLPRPQLGDPHETLNDKLDLMRHYPMTAGHAVCVVFGVVVGFTAAIYVGLVWGNGVGFIGLLFMGLAWVAWWVGYALFPRPRRPGQRCAICGYDLRACTAPRCPECGTPFDPRRVKLRIAAPHEVEKPD
jgi:hypothetical protein